MCPECHEKHKYGEGYYELSILSSRSDMAAHPQKYTAYAFTQVGGSLQKVEVDWKDPKEGEVVVKVLACGVCGR